MYFDTAPYVRFTLQHQNILQRNKHIAINT